MIALDEARARVGSGVVYGPPHREETFGWNTGITEAPASRKEDGVITSVNDAYVFVRYAGDQHSKATSPDDLEFLAP